MKLLLQRPFLAVGLVLLWLALTDFSWGHLILALCVAFIAVALASPLQLPRSRVLRWGPLFRLAGIVFLDIIASNIAVARIVLGGPAAATRNAGFLDLDLRLRDENAIALLAIIVTATPGTAWLNYDRATGRLCLHILDLSHPEEWRATINGRYERLLIEAFE